MAKGGRLRRTLPRDWFALVEKERRPEKPAAAGLHGFKPHPPHQGAKTQPTDRVYNLETGFSTGDSFVMKRFVAFHDVIADGFEHIRMNEDPLSSPVLACALVTKDVKA